MKIISRILPGLKKWPIRWLMGPGFKPEIRLSGLKDDPLAGLRRENFVEGPPKVFHKRH